MMTETTRMMTPVLTSTVSLFHMGSDQEALRPGDNLGIHQVRVITPEPRVTGSMPEDGLRLQGPQQDVFKVRMGDMRVCSYVERVKIVSFLWQSMIFAS